MNVNYTETALRHLKSMRRMARITPLVEVDIAAFPHLSRRTYDALRDSLARDDFNFLADLEIKELSRDMKLFHPAVIRAYLSADGTIALSHYQLKRRMQQALMYLRQGLRNGRYLSALRVFLAGLVSRHLFDLTTEFTDGTFLVTSSAAKARAFSDPATLQREFLPFNTSPRVLLARHRQSLDQRLAQGARPVVLRTLEDKLASGRRLMELKSAHRRAINWISREELRALGYDEKTGNAVFEEIRRLLRKEAVTRQAPAGPASNDPLGD